MRFPLSEAGICPAFFGALVWPYAASTAKLANHVALRTPAPSHPDSAPPPPAGERTGARRRTRRQQPYPLSRHRYFAGTGRTDRGRGGAGLCVETGFHPAAADV